MELENLRNSMNREMESVRGACEKETNELKQKMEILEQENQNNDKINRGNDSVYCQITIIIVTCMYMYMLPLFINLHVQLNM